MDINLEEIASYMPSQNSPFSELVKELYGLNKIRKYHAYVPGLAGGQTPQNNPILGWNNNGGVTPDETEGQNPNKLKEAIQTEGVPKLLDDTARKITQINVSGNYYDANNIILDANKEVEGTVKDKHTVDIIKMVIAGILVTLVTKSSPNVANTASFDFSVDTAVTSLNVRSSASSENNNNIISSLPKGVVVRVIGEEGEFYELNCNDVPNINENVRCFASKDYLRFIIPRGD